MPHTRHYTHTADRCYPRPPRPRPPPPEPPPEPPPPPPPDTKAVFVAFEMGEPHACCQEGMTLADAKLLAIDICNMGRWEMVELYWHNCETAFHNVWNYDAWFDCAEQDFGPIPEDDCICVDPPCPPV